MTPMRGWFRVPAATALILLSSGCAGGWRNGPPPGASEPASAPAPATATALANVPTRTTVTPDGVLFVWKDGGQSVSLAGEFNAWDTAADPLSRQPDGTWALSKPLAPGRYAYKFVIDGSTWKEDPTATETVDDGYGGKNSVVVVGPGAGPAPATGGAAPAPAVTGRAKPPEITAGGVTFTFAGAATSVALAGEFNQWSTTADPMARQPDGTWTITRQLAPGTYGYKFVVNGTTWKQDEANPQSTDDGFGGKNSVVTVP
jgi:1,4-alpha-glucan branching enzyme